jgi:hypothetical protein
MKLRKPHAARGQQISHGYYKHSNSNQKQSQDTISREQSGKSILVEHENTYSACLIN